MRVPLHVVLARREKLAALIERRKYLPVRELCRILGVSEATARRDLAHLEQQNKVTRTHGGALAEFNERFPSFHDRQDAGAEGKKKIGRAALRFLRAGGTYFFDSGTTVHAIAEAYLDNPVVPVRIVTSNLPVGELLAPLDGIEIFLTGGQILGRQSVLLGEAALRSLEFWSFDVAFLSAEAANPSGIWNSQETIVRQQHVALRRSRRALFCLHSAKIGREAPHLLLPWSEVDLLLTDASASSAACRRLPLHPSRLLSTDASGQLPEVPSPAGQSLPVHYL